MLYFKIPAINPEGRMIKIIECGRPDDEERRQARDLLTNDLIKWEQALKSIVLPCKRFTLVTYAVTAEPDRSVMTIGLDAIFPVLTFASGGTALPLQSAVHGDSRIDILVSLKTRVYGPVIIVGASVDDDLERREESDMRFDANEVGDVSLSLINHGYIANRHLHYVTLAIPNEVCFFCKRSIRKRYKCSRCWMEIRFPVYYCNRTCQAADFPRHKVCCGVKLLNQ